MVSLLVNNQTISVSNTFTVYQSCVSAGVHVPRFCFHDRLIISGNCRICLVEIKGSLKLEASCSKLVSSGIEVFTDSPLVLKARESILEFILKNHPLDCPICDQGGFCDLQDYSYSSGSTNTRYSFIKKAVSIKNWGFLLGTVITRCILCTRCVRFNSECCENSCLGTFGRGEFSEISYEGSSSNSIFSGNLVDLCPVSFFTFKYFL